MSDNLFSPLPTANQFALGEIQDGPPIPWEATEVLSEAWEKFKANAAILIISTLVIFFASFLINMIVQLPINLITTGIQVVAEDNEALVVLVMVVGAVLGGGIQFLVNAVAMIGLTKMHLAVARGQTADLNMLASGYGRIFTLMGAQLLVGLAVFAGLLFFIIPGVILGYGLAVSQYYAIDSELGAVDCLRRSWEVMDGNKVKLFMTFLLLMIASFFVVIFTCGMGALVAMPMMGITTGIIFTRVTGRTGLPAQE